jgi:hypothetical protein
MAQDKDSDFPFLDEEDNYLSWLVHYKAPLLRYPDHPPGAQPMCFMLYTKHAQRLRGMTLCFYLNHRINNAVVSTYKYTSPKDSPPRTRIHRQRLLSNIIRRLPGGS